MPAFTIFVALLASQTSGASAPTDLLAKARSALSSTSVTKLADLFVRKADSNYLFAMAKRVGGLATLQVRVFPSPPGWTDTGYWAIFSGNQDIEGDHDVIFPLIKTGEGLKIGREIPEWTPVSRRIEHLATDVVFATATGSATIRSTMTLKVWEGAKSPLIRLGRSYECDAAYFDGQKTPVEVATETSVPKVPANGFIQAGGVIIPYFASLPSKISFAYHGSPAPNYGDRITPKYAYLTAWWAPSIGRLPHTSSVRIEAPKEWVVRSEGVLQTEPFAEFPTKSPGEGMQVATYKCDIPISFPKVIGGLYVLAAEARDPGKSFKSWQFAPVDEARGKADVQNMVTAARFYESKLTPWPFPGYECFDGIGYYGIESYSYTLLTPRITTHSVAHEMGHTYFGAITPCTYVHDSWNEGVTTYVDDILTGKFADRPLEEGLSSMKIAAPLTHTDSGAWDNDNFSYFRGGYVMRMLENELGTETMLAGLKQLLASRVGLDTTWDDLRPSFEKASGRDLKWFWEQWIDRAVFPEVKVVSASTERKGGKNVTHVTVRQSGTENPYKVRFLVRGLKGAEVVSKVGVMTSPEQTFDLESDFSPTSADIDVKGYCLARTGPALPVSRP